MRLYSKTHEWFDAETKEMGITNFAANELGDIVYVGLPEEGDEIFEGVQFADIESVKAVAEIYSLVEGVVLEINQEVVDNPAFLNEDAESHWLIKADTEVNIDHLFTTFMTREEYEQFILEH